MPVVTPNYGIPMEDPSGVTEAATFNKAMIRVDEVILASKKAYQTKTAMTFYIDPINGTDDKCEGTVGRPFKTWAGLIRSGLLPKYVEGCNVTIFVAAGDLDAMILSGYEAVDGYVMIIGEERLAVLTTGPNTGTSTGGDDTYIEMTGANWTPGELAGKFYKIVGGTHAGYEGTILDNGTESITGLQPTVLPRSRLEPLLAGLGVERGHLHVVEVMPRRPEALAALLRA